MCFSISENAHIVQIMLPLWGSHSLLQTLGTSSLLALPPLLMPSAKQCDCILFRCLPNVKLASLSESCYYLNLSACVGNGLGWFSVKLWLNFLAGRLPRCSTSTPPWLPSSLHKQVSSFQWPWGTGHCEFRSCLFGEMGGRGSWSVRRTLTSLYTLSTFHSCLANMAL